ncbi:MAG: YkvA family protein [Vallitaleaceae bacterium]|jgi:uncharacterized membrane protein YkvA (DUF1232 family)|nr:YkvA family protein [Vallitaleaceae bacterium]
MDKSNKDVSKSQEEKSNSYQNDDIEYLEASSLISSKKMKKKEGKKKFKDDYEVPSDDVIKKILKEQAKKSRKILGDKERIFQIINDVLDKTKNIPVLGAMVEDIRILSAMVRDYISKKYVKIPVASIVMAVSALIYIVSPIDLIPDIIPGIGYLDDAAVMHFVIQALHNDIQTYRDWKENQS